MQRRRLVGRRDGDGYGWKWEQGSVSPRRSRRFMGRRVLGIPIILAAAAALALLVLWPSGNAPAAHASDGLSIVKGCSPEAAVPGAVQYVFEISNSSGEGLDRVGVDDSVLGPITGDFPAHLTDGQSATVYRTYVTQESDPRPLVNVVTATYQTAAGVQMQATDDCSVQIAHMTISKTLIVNADSTFIFTITNDGNVLLRRFMVIDSGLGNITSHFPFELAVGESKEVRITVPGQQICDNEVTAVYQSVPRATRVTATAICETGEQPGLSAVKECFPKTGSVGDPINVRVNVTNTGDVPLTVVSVVDSDAGVLSTDNSGDVNGNGLLDPAETWVYTGSYLGAEGDNLDQATVIVETPDGIQLTVVTNQENCVREKPPDGEGCTPGYWRNHLEAWGPTGYSPGDDFDGTFGVDLFDPDITLEEAVNAKGGGVNKLARHGTAALLGAAHPDVNYPFSVAEVVAAVQAGDVDALVKANELGCPID